MIIMPNHITNTLMCKDMHKLFKKYVDEEGGNRVFSFEKIIPMPEDICKKKALSIRDMDMPNWYDWSIENWGTKWDAYDITLMSNYIEFDTAWNTPLPIFARMSKELDIPIYATYSDEDIFGGNCGGLRAIDGIVERVPPEIMFALFAQGYTDMMDAIDTAIDDYEIKEVVYKCR